MSRPKPSARPDPVAVALANVTHPTKPGTLFLGPAGSGKTHLLRSVLEDVRSSPKLSSRPLEANFAGAPANDVWAGISAPGQPSARKILLVDDLDTLPPRALRQITNGMDEGTIHLIGACRDEAATRLMKTLRSCRTPTVVMLEPWDDDRLARHAEETLDAPLSQWNVHQLVQYTGGNPLCLTELVEQGRVNNSLDRHEGLWVWHGPLYLPTIAAARLGAIVRRLPPELNDLLACLAVLGSEDSARLGPIVGEEAVQAAEEEALVTAGLGPGGEPIYRLRRPVEGRVALEQASWSRRRRLCGSMVGKLLPSLLAAGEDLKAVRVIRFGRTVGLTAPLEMRLRMAGASLQCHDYATGEWLLQGLPHSPELVALRLQINLEQCRFADAGDILLERSGPSPPVSWSEAEEGGMMHGPLPFRRRAAATALRTMSGAPSAVPPEYGCETEWTQWADAWTGHRLARLLVTGEQSLPELDDVHAGWSDRHQQVLTRTMLAAVQAGRLEHALSIGERADPRTFTPIFRLAWWTLMGFANLTRGNTRDAHRIAMEMVRVGLHEAWPQAYTLGVLLAGRICLARAEPQRALRYLNESLAVSGPGTLSITSLLATESRALAHAMLGHTSHADRSREGPDWQAASAAPQLFVALAQISRAETLYCLGHRHQALALAEEAGDAALPPGQLLAAFLAYSLAARIDSTRSRLRLLADLAAQCDFDLAHRGWRYIEALENGDSNALAHVADEYFKRDLRWLGAAAAAAAVRTATPAMERAASMSLARRNLHDVTAAGVLVPGAGDVAHIPLLTPREQEIAEAVADGRTSAGIANSLRLSSRTVENHLQRVYRKLGISKRTELAAALAGYASRTGADQGWYEASSER